MKKISISIFILINRSNCCIIIITVRVGYKKKRNIRYSKRSMLSLVHVLLAITQFKNYPNSYIQVLFFNLYVLSLKKYLKIKTFVLLRNRFFFKTLSLKYIYQKHDLKTRFTNFMRSAIDCIWKATKNS